MRARVTHIIIACICLLPSMSQASPREHVLKPNETFSHLAAKYGCKTEAIASANPTLSAHRIRVGSRIVIPASCSGERGKSERRLASSKAALSKTNRRLGPRSSKTQRKRASSLDKERVKKRTSRRRLHVIAADETLWSVAQKNGCSHQELVAANKHRIKSPRLIQIGQTIIVPRCRGKKRRRGKKSVKGGSGPAAHYPSHSCDWSPDDVEIGGLVKIMKKRGFRPPDRFRALLVKTVLSRDRRRIVGHRVLSWGKRALDWRGWNPASTIKLYAALAALEQVRRYGFGVDTTVTFHYRRGRRSFALKKLFEDSVHWSKNIAHNRLVQLAGFDYLNGEGGTLQRAGLDHTYIMRAYAQSAWLKQGHQRSLRYSPSITLREGKRKRRIRARRGKGRYPCGSAACTSLSDLSKAMCRMMLHEQLPRARQLRLGSGQSPHLKLLRLSMDKKRRGHYDPGWAALEKRLTPKSGYRFFRKGGYSRGWLSENMYIYNPRTRTRWIISLAAYATTKVRDSLTSASAIIADLITGHKI
jgi:LysM repeat protein